ncbi:helix-turn-helix domain-containing protein [Dysgonomonas sp. Marseille-P4361]|uniref:helix-turn-helix domain-containing protein n=1 Tax=Dysgonomonas sp. Marseille-P4361 TaxID=2161820 RepID=UPI000D561266|nr:helix-turn-helix transcriptional regulator [Dysgonomonas sp. Marseille-P4361]
MTQIGKNIKKIRNVMGLSQQAFADLFELTRGNISSYEEGRADPRIEVIIRIANYFSIPLSDLIQKDLSVNELLHYNAGLVLETERLKVGQQLLKIPYIPILYIDDYIRQYSDEEFIARLPQIIVPTNSKFKQLAFEVENPDALPAEYNYHSGDILIMENVVKENIHRISNKLGIMIDGKEIKAGMYKEKEDNITLALNEWVEYPFNINSLAQYWVLRAVYSQIV